MTDRVLTRRYQVRSLWIVSIEIVGESNIPTIQTYLSKVLKKWDDRNISTCILSLIVVF